MTPNNSNMIQPVQNLSVLNAPAVIKDRPKNGKKQLHSKKKKRETAHSEPLEQEPDLEEEIQTLSKNDSGRHHIDYCA